VVAKYLFDEGAGTVAIDSSGFGNHGTIVGSTYVEDTPLPYPNNYALEFHGPIGHLVPAECYVMIPDTTSLRPQLQISIKAWIKATNPSNPHNSVIVAKQLGMGVADSYALWHACDNSIRFMVHGSEHIWAPIPSFYEWHHVEGVWDGSSVKLYINASEVDSASFVGPILYDGNPVLIGADDNNDDDIPDGVWNGIIDEVVIRGQTELQAAIDINPDTLNLKSKGKWITCYIGLFEGYAVGDIDVDSILLEGLLEVQHSEVQDSVLMVKFDRQDIIWYIEDALEIEPPADVSLVVTGELTDGTPFEGTDTIRVINPGK